MSFHEYGQWISLYNHFNPTDRYYIDLDNYEKTIPDIPPFQPSLAMPRERRRDIEHRNIDEAITECLRNNIRVWPAAEARIQTYGKRPCLADWRELVAIATPSLEGTIKQAHNYNMAYAGIYQLPTELLELVDSYLPFIDSLAFRLSARKLLVALKAIIRHLPGLTDQNSMAINNVLGKSRFAQICKAENDGKLVVMLPIISNIELEPVVSAPVLIKKKSRIKSLFKLLRLMRTSKMEHKAITTNELSQIPAMASTQLYACSCCHSAHPANMFKERELHTIAERRICYEERPLKICEHITLRHRDLCRMLSGVQADSSNQMLLSSPQISCEGHCDDVANPFIRLFFARDRTVFYLGMHSLTSEKDTWSSGTLASKVHAFLRWGPVCKHLGYIEHEELVNWLLHVKGRMLRGYIPVEVVKPVFHRQCSHENCDSSILISYKHHPVASGSFSGLGKVWEIRIETAWQWPPLEEIPGPEWAFIMEKFRCGQSDADGRTPWYQPVISRQFAGTLPWPRMAFS
jgi:hypothetical protein